MKILVGYLKSPEGQAALARAIEEARLRGWQLVVLHSMRGGTRDESEQVLEYREELEEIHKRLEDEGIDYEVRQLVRGRTPAQDLIEFSREEDVELIVIGIRRRSPVGKLVLGSNAQDILLQADCAVLSVKAAVEDEGA